MTVLAITITYWTSFNDIWQLVFMQYKVCQFTTLISIIGQSPNSLYSFETIIMVDATFEEGKGAVGGAIFENANMTCCQSIRNGTCPSSTYVEACAILEGFKKLQQTHIIVCTFYTNMDSLNFLKALSTTEEDNIIEWSNNLSLCKNLSTHKFIIFCKKFK